MPTTNDFAGSGIGRLGKQAKPRFKSILRRSHLSGVNKVQSQTDEVVYCKALKAMSLDNIRTEIASQHIAIDDDVNRSLTSPSIAPWEVQSPTKPKAINVRLMAALPKFGLHFPDKNYKLKLVLGRQWKDLKVVRALYQDMPRGKKPHERYVQPLLTVTFQTATQLVEDGNLGPIEDADAMDTTQHMWKGFLRKLHGRIQLNWPTELSFTLFTSFFSALVDARQTAKEQELAGGLEAEELQELDNELAGLTVNSNSSKNHKGNDVKHMIKPSVRNPERPPGELVKTIDRFLDAVIAAGTIWMSIEEVGDIE